MSLLSSPNGLSEFNHGNYGEVSEMGSLTNGRIGDMSGVYTPTQMWERMIVGQES